MDLGKISWAEHSQAVGQGGMNVGSFQNQWHWSDPYGVSTDLIPPGGDPKLGLATSLNADDSGNSPATGQIQWHAADENHAKIYSYKPSGSAFPCFQVFLANGYMEEYGCTPDSLQTYSTANTSCQSTCQATVYPANWYLDEIKDRHDNVITISYQQSTSGAEVEPRTILWDTTPSGGVNITHHKIMFNASVNPTNKTNGPIGCNKNASLRCDDPVDLSATGGLASPSVMGSLALNSVYVDTSTDGTTWHTVRSYAFSYEQSGPQTITDPVTNNPVSVAGYFDLTKVQEFGFDGTTAYPATTLGYTTQTQLYEDSSYQPGSLSDCGPSWNVGNGGNCFLWSQSYAGNSRYLSSINNGMGQRETLTWGNARNNTHGTPAGGAATDPFYCTTHQTNTYPCDAADDQAWSRIVLTEHDSSVNVIHAVAGVPLTNPSTHKTVYTYQLSSLTARICADCAVGMYWGDQTDTDLLDYYNERFMGFAQVATSQSDGSLQVYQFESTEGIGAYTTDTSKVTCGTSGNGQPLACQSDPWWDTPNAAAGWPYDVKFYDVNGTTLLKETTDVPNPVCPPTGVTATPAYTPNGPTGPTYGPWAGNLVAELDHGNPRAVCDVQHGAMNAYTQDGSATNTVQTHQGYTYDSLGRVTDDVMSDATGNRGAIDTQTTYVWEDDQQVPAPSGASGQGINGAYEIDKPAQVTVADANGNRVACRRWQYDYNPYQTGQITDSYPYPTGNDANGVQLTTADTRYTSCGTAPSYTPSGPLQTTYFYNGMSSGQGLGTGDLVVVDDPRVNAKSPRDLSQAKCQSPDYDNPADAFGSICYGRDNVTDQVTSVAHQNLTSSTGLDPTTGWTMSSTDANNQTTNFDYDALGRVTSVVEPNIKNQSDSTTAPTKAVTYTNFCPATGASTPCVEVDTTQRLDSGGAVTVRQFYDGAGHLAETRTPTTGGQSPQDSVQYFLYDTMGNQRYVSNPYLVNAYTGAAGSGAYSVPDENQVGSTVARDGLGRVTSTVDAQSHTTTSAYNVVAGVGGDTSHYEQVIVTDANSHRTDTLIDALGRVAYTRTYTGNSPSTWNVYATTSYTYDAAGRLLSTTDPLGKQSTRHYDTAGRLTSATDPDLGNSTYTYDADGNLVQSQQGVIASYAGYDNLDRMTWKGPNSDGSNQLANWTYDLYNTADNPPVLGMGRVGTEHFFGTGAAGEYDYNYDARGDLTNWTMRIGPNTTNEAKYPFTLGYNDAGQKTTTTYPDGDTVTTHLTAQDLLDSVTEQLTTSSPTTTLVDNLGYTGTAGAAGLPTSATVGDNGSNVLNTGTNWTLAYDSLLRPTDTTVQTIAPTPTTLYDQALTYDPVGNTSTVDTTLGANSAMNLPGGTDNQQFCYDELDRLTSASTSATTPCGTQNNGTLTTANYTSAFTYDQNNRLTSSPAGTYTYGDPNHENAVTAIGSTYTAAYDTSGNMLCRAPAAGPTCSQTTQAGGQLLSYDILNRLTNWQNASGPNPTQTSTYAYDGEGNRVQQTLTDNSVAQATTTDYIGSYQEVRAVTQSGGCQIACTQTTTTKYYDAGVTTAVNVNGTTSYLVKNYQGSTDETLSANTSTTTTVNFEQLFSPYGGPRYSQGTPPTDIGYTGDHGDPSGLIYMNARYYDPTAAQFTTADTAQGPNRYNYTDGNPTTYTDPTGHTPMTSPMTSAAEVHLVYNTEHAYALAQLNARTGSQAAQVALADAERLVASVRGFIPGGAKTAAAAVEDAQKVYEGWNAARAAGKLKNVSNTYLVRQALEIAYEGAKSAGAVGKAAAGAAEIAGAEGRAARAGGRLFAILPFISTLMEGFGWGFNAGELGWIGMDIVSSPGANGYDPYADGYGDKSGADGVMTPPDASEPKWDPLDAGAPVTWPQHDEHSDFEYPDGVNPGDMSKDLPQPAQPQQPAQPVQPVQPAQPVNSGDGIA